MLTILMWLTASAFCQNTPVPELDPKTRQLLLEHCITSSRARSGLAKLDRYRDERLQLEASLLESVSLLDHGSAVLLWQYLGRNTIQLSSNWMPILREWYEIDHRRRYNRISNREYSRREAAIRRLEGLTDAGQQAVARVITDELLELARLDQTIAADTVTYLVSAKTVAHLEIQLRQLAPDLSIPDYSRSSHIQCHAFRE